MLMLTAHDVTFLLGSAAASSATVAASDLPVTAPCPKHATPLVVVAFVNSYESKLFTHRLSDDVGMPSGATCKPRVFVQCLDVSPPDSTWTFGWEDFGCWRLRRHTIGQRGFYHVVLGFSSELHGQTFAVHGRLSVCTLQPKTPAAGACAVIQQAREEPTWSLGSPPGCVGYRMFLAHVVNSNCDEVIERVFVENDTDFVEVAITSGPNSALRYFALYKCHIDTDDTMNGEAADDFPHELVGTPAAGDDVGVPLQYASCRRGGAPDKPSRSAAGIPCDWKSRHHWRKTTRQKYPTSSPVNINDVIEFLQLRIGPGGSRPVRELLGPPIRFWDGWFCFPLRAFRDDPDEERWQRAWHGTKFEALFAILHQGALRESADESRGERYIQNQPGVYVHGDATWVKVEWYAKWSNLCGDGVFWRVKWELRVDMHKRVPLSKSDQWVFPSHAVVLASLWVCGRRAEDMVCGDNFSSSWDPSIESAPTQVPPEPIPVTKPVLPSPPPVPLESPPTQVPPAPPPVPLEAAPTQVPPKLLPSPLLAPAKKRMLWWPSPPPLPLESKPRLQSPVRNPRPVEVKQRPPMPPPTDAPTTLSPGLVWREGDTVTVHTPGSSSGPAPAVVPVVCVHDLQPHVLPPAPPPERWPAGQPWPPFAERPAGPLESPAASPFQ